MWREYINADTVEEVVSILGKLGRESRIVAGATDLMLEIERGQKSPTLTLIDISRIQHLGDIRLDEHNVIHIGPMVTHNQCIASKLICECALPLAQASWEVGSPQIRNRGTIAGNVITGSPANDTITPLVALGGQVVLKSIRGERVVSLEDFYTGVRKTVMQPDEMLIDIFFPALKDNQKGIYVKYALRQAQAISVINLSIILEYNADLVNKAAITLGAVAPTIMHAKEAEFYLRGKRLTPEVIEKAGEYVHQAVKPIDDIRGSAKYRRKIAEVITKRALKSIAENTNDLLAPRDPILLASAQNGHSKSAGKTIIDDHTPITTTINGKKFTFLTGQNKTLSRLLREEGLMTGVKEGCGEGECGACTVFLDGKAVMSCIVPAPRADGADIITIEGIASEENLHPVQQAFIDAGAVQCGYCTPGLIMSTVKLLEEKPNPNRNQIQQALTGNLCRCTGYYKIIEAVEKSAREINHGKI